MDSQFPAMGLHSFVSRYQCMVCSTKIETLIENWLAELVLICDFKYVHRVLFSDLISWHSKIFPLNGFVRVRWLKWDGRWTDNKNLHFENQQELFGRIRWKFKIIRANARSMIFSQSGVLLISVLGAVDAMEAFICHAIFPFVSRSLVRLVFMIKLSSLVRSASTVSSNTTFLHLFDSQFFLVHSFDIPIVCLFYTVNWYFILGYCWPKSNA